MNDSGRLLFDSMTTERNCHHHYRRTIDYLLLLCSYSYSFRFTFSYLWVDARSMRYHLRYAWSAFRLGLTRSYPSPRSTIWSWSCLTTSGANAQSMNTQPWLWSVKENSAWWAPRLTMSRRSKTWTLIQWRWSTSRGAHSLSSRNRFPFPPRAVLSHHRRCRPFCHRWWIHPSKLSLCMSFARRLPRHRRRWQRRAERRRQWTVGHIGWPASVHCSSNSRRVFGRECFVRGECGTEFGTYWSHLLAHPRSLQSMLQSAGHCRSFAPANWLAPQCHWRQYTAEG